MRLVQSLTGVDTRVILPTTHTASSCPPFAIRSASTLSGRVDLKGSFVVRAHVCRGGPRGRPDDAARSRSEPFRQGAGTDTGTTAQAFCLPTAFERNGEDHTRPTSAFPADVTLHSFCDDIPSHGFTSQPTTSRNPSNANNAHHAYYA